MKILLCTVPIDFRTNPRNIFRIMPLNLMSLASGSGVCDVEILDTIALRMNEKEAEEEIRKQNPDVLGFSVTTPQLKNSLALARAFKESRPDGKVIFGGVHTTVLPGDTMRQHDSVDFEVIGEGEITFSQLLNKLAGGQDPSGLPGLISRINGDLAEGSPREPIEDLDTLPFPAYDKIPFNQYWISASRRRPAGFYIGSRGCPYHCSYCSANIVLGQRFRGHSPERVVEDLARLIADYKVRDISFKDSNWHLIAERTHRICTLMEQKGMDLTWNANCRVDQVDEEILRRMRKAGCWLVRFGVETIDEEISRVIHRGSISKEQVIQAVKTAERVGMSTQVFLMIGLPRETWQTFENNIQFFKKLNPSYLSATIAIPFPGTEFYEWAKSNGYLTTNDWNDFWMSSPVHETKDFSKEDMIKAQRKAIFSFYLNPKNILKRIRHLSRIDVFNFLFFLRYWLFKRKLYTD